MTNKLLHKRFHDTVLGEVIESIYENTVTGEFFGDLETVDGEVLVLTGEYPEENEIVDMMEQLIVTYRLVG